MRHKESPRRGKKSLGTTGSVFAAALQMEDWGFTSIRLAQLSAATAGSVPTFTPLSKIYTSEQLREAGDSHTLLSDAHKRQWAQVEGQEILFKCVEKHFPGGEEQELVAQRGCRGSK